MGGGGDYMSQKYLVLLLHLNLFTHQLKLEEEKRMKNLRFCDMYNREILNPLYMKYRLYLVVDEDSKGTLAIAQMLGVLPYVQDVFSLQFNYPMDMIMNKIHLTNPSKYLMCGRNLEHEIMLANRCGMDNCYIGEQNYSNIIMPTYHVKDPIDIQKVLKLR